MKKIPGTKRDYFKELNLKDHNIKEIFNIANDTRKFELELYWRRATYYWTFIAATFAAYFLLFNSEKSDSILLFMVSCVGLTFSLAWYLANRGSKYWVENWEKHVDILEDEYFGPLFKRVLDKNNYNFCPIYKSYPYSVTKINHVLSFYLSLIWFFLVAYSFIIFCKLNSFFPDYEIIWIIIVFIFTITTLWQLFKSKSRKGDHDPFTFQEREIPKK